LFVGVGGHIAAIDSATGEELWRTKLKTANVATVSIVGDRIYGAASGELFCLDPATGAIMWRNRLKGLGMGVVVFPGMGDAVAASVSEHQRRASAAAV
jgi:outer membrane protein assembly factor BamB